MLQRQKKTVVWITGVIILTCCSLYIGRNVILQHWADKCIKQAEQHHALHIQYEKLSLKGCNTLCIRKLNIIPVNQDTLLFIDHLDIQMHFLKMLTGNLQIKEVILNKLHLNLIKNGNKTNYSILFQNKENKNPTHSPDTSNNSYDKQLHTLLSWFYELIPKNGHITQCRISEKYGHSHITFLLPELHIVNHRFKTNINIAEDSLPVQQWNLKGEIIPQTRELNLKVYTSKGSLRVPYIQRKLQANVQFDTLTYHVTETISSKDFIQLNGQISVQNLQVFQPALSPDTIRLNKGMLDYKLLVGSQYLKLDSTSYLCFNHLKLHPYIYLKKKTSKASTNCWQFKASLNKPWFPAEKLFQSLPDGLFNNVKGLQAEGELSYHGLINIDFSQPDSLKIESELHKRNFRITHYGHTNLTKMNEEFQYTAYENGQPVRTFPIGPSWEHFTPLQQISPLLQMSVLQSEDGAFFYHQGFLIEAFREALIQDIKEKRFARGGSTISMQLVKNVFLNRKKNIARKLEEALIVWLIENQNLTSKERMFEVYMNIIEWGPQIYGAHEASFFYFNKLPSQLSVEEAIFLASIIPKPKHFQNSFNENRELSGKLKGYYKLIAERLAKKGLITEMQATNIQPVIQLTGPAKNYLYNVTTNEK